MKRHPFIDGTVTETISRRLHRHRRSTGDSTHHSHTALLFVAAAKAHRLMYILVVNEINRVRVKLRVRCDGASGTAETVTHASQH